MPTDFGREQQPDAPNDYSPEDTLSRKYAGYEAAQQSGTSSPCVATGLVMHRMTLLPCCRTSTELPSTAWLTPVLRVNCGPVAMDSQSSPATALRLEGGHGSLLGSSSAGQQALDLARQAEQECLSDRAHHEPTVSSRYGGGVQRLILCTKGPRHRNQPLTTKSLLPLFDGATALESKHTGHTLRVGTAIPAKTDRPGLQRLVLGFDVCVEVGRRLSSALEFDIEEC